MTVVGFWIALAAVAGAVHANVSPGWTGPPKWWERLYTTPAVAALYALLAWLVIAGLTRDDLPAMVP